MFLFAVARNDSSVRAHGENRLRRRLQQGPNCGFAFQRAFLCLFPSRDIRPNHVLVGIPAEEMLEASKMAAMKLRSTFRTSPGIRRSPSSI